MAKPPKDDSRDPVEILHVEVKGETALALLCRAGSVERWIAKSQMMDGTTINGRGDFGTLVIPRWLAKDKQFLFAGI